MLTPRQESILYKVVDGYLRGGQPVGSKLIAADPDLECSASTVRNELALLEEHGLLAHPHTSAGRVPTDAGHRYLVDRLLEAPRSPSGERGLELSLMRREVEEAMRVTTETLSQVTNLLAVVSAPSEQVATIRHIEVLALQAQVVLVVVVTSTGGVSKMLTTFERAVDPGLIAWAGEYLNEQLGGLELGARMVHQRLIDPTLSTPERAFVDRLAIAFDEVSGASHDALYVGGTAHLFAGETVVDARQVEELMNLLERRVLLLRMLRVALLEPDVYVRIGHENELSAMHPWALVATAYGPVQRKLGTVSVIGPVHMDYGQAIAAVRGAAGQLSRYVEDAYTAG